MRLQGKVAIVTGAGGGIGAAICRRFAAEGAALIGVDLAAAALASMATSVRAAGGRVQTLVADVAEEASAEAAVACARGEFGGLDVLVSNAVCDLPLAPLTRLTLADWRRSSQSRCGLPVLQACHSGHGSSWRRKYHLDCLAARTRRACGTALVLRRQGRADPTGQGDGARPRRAEYPRQ